MGADKKNTWQSQACLPRLSQIRAPRHCLPTASPECLESFDQTVSSWRFVSAPAGRQELVVCWGEKQASTFFEKGIGTSYFVLKCLERNKCSWQSEEKSPQACFEEKTSQKRQRAQTSCAEECVHTKQIFCKGCGPFVQSSQTARMVVQAHPMSLWRCMVSSFLPRVAAPWKGSSVLAMPRVPAFQWCYGSQCASSCSNAIAACWWSCLPILHWISKKRVSKAWPLTWDMEAKASLPFKRFAQRLWQLKQNVLKQLKRRDAWLACLKPMLHLCARWGWEPRRHCATSKPLVLWSEKNVWCICTI